MPWNTIRLLPESMTRLHRSRQGTHGMFITSMPFGYRNATQCGENLQEKGVGCAVHYPVPIHLQEACRNLGYKEGAFPIAESLAEQFLSLPMFPELTTEQIEYVARCVSETVGAGALV